MVTKGGGGDLQPGRLVDQLVVAGCASEEALKRGLNSMCTCGAGNKLVLQCNGDEQGANLQPDSLATRC
eukprot:1151015-Pelagomonas_calceolata.AAC.6